MTKEQKIQWQRQVATAIVNPAAIPAADKLRLLCEWPILRAWAQSVLKRDPNKVPAKTIDAYLRDALAWSGHLGDPADLIRDDTQDAADAFFGAFAASPQHPSMAGVSPKKPQAISAVNVKSAGVSTPSADNNEIPERPTHFDQYRHVCPAELGEQFDNEITDLYLLRSELGAKRDQLADLVEQAMYAGEEAVEDQYSAQLSEVAQQLVNAETTLLHFWALVDVAFRYYQLNGEVMPIEDLRAEAPVSSGSPAVRKRAPRTPDYTKAEIDDMFAAAAYADDKVAAMEAAEAQKAERIRKNGNFLRDKRKADAARANGGESYNKWRAQIILRANEMNEWGEALTSVQQEIVALASAE